MKNSFLVHGLHTQPMINENKNYKCLMNSYTSDYALYLIVVQPPFALWSKTRKFGLKGFSIVLLFYFNKNCWNSIKKSYSNSLKLINIKIWKGSGYIVLLWAHKERDRDELAPFRY